MNKIKVTYTPSMSTLGTTDGVGYTIVPRRQKGKNMSILTGILIVAFIVALVALLRDRSATNITTFFVALALLLTVAILSGNV